LLLILKLAFSPYSVDNRQELTPIKSIDVFFDSRGNPCGYPAFWAPVKDAPTEDWLSRPVDGCQNLFFAKNPSSQTKSYGGQATQNLIVLPFWGIIVNFIVHLILGGRKIKARNRVPRYIG
jgi:hypothetical protein